MTVGAWVVHLAHGLAKISAIEETMGVRSFVVVVDDREHWVPEVAWHEHLRPIPTKEEVEAWRATIATLAPAGGEAAAIRRERTLAHRDFDRQLAALAEAYVAGDPHGVGALEARLLPILAHSLGVSVDALRAELHTMRRAPSAEVSPVIAPLATGLEVMGVALLPSRIAVGDRGEVGLDVLAGRWLGQRWPGDHEDVLIVVHEDHVAAWTELVAELEHVATASTDCAQALLYDPAILDDPQASDEIYDPVDGTIAGKGFALPLGGDGDFAVHGAARGGRIVCLATGALASFLEHRQGPEGRERAAFATLSAWRAGRLEHDDAVVKAITSLPATSASVAELQRVFDRARSTDEALAIHSATRLARLAPDPMPPFRWLVESFERGPVVRYPNPHNSIIHILRARGDAAIGAHVVERLVADHPAWRSGRDAFLEAMQVGGHAVPASLVAQSPCARATSLCEELAREPSRCETAEDLIAFVASYPQLPSNERSYGPAQFDALIAALRAHATACPACRTLWVRLLFEVKRADLRGEPRRVAWSAAGSSRR